MGLNEWVWWVSVNKWFERPVLEWQRNNTMWLVNCDTRYMYFHVLSKTLFSSRQCWRGYTVPKSAWLGTEAGILVQVRCPRSSRFSFCPLLQAKLFESDSWVRVSRASALRSLCNRASRGKVYCQVKYLLPLFWIFRVQTCKCILVCDK